MDDVYKLVWLRQERGGCMMTLIRKKIDVKAPLTDKQMIELENAASMKVVMDDDCPEITDAEFAKFVEMAKKGGKSIESL